MCHQVYHGLRHSVCQNEVDEVCGIGSDKKCQVDTMREYHTEYSTTIKAIQDRQCGKMDELFCPSNIRTSP